MRSLIPWRSSSVFDRVFSDFMDELSYSTGRPLLKLDTEFSPRVDVRDSKKEILVSAELPGMDEKDIHVILNDDRLTIKGEKRVEREGGDSDRHYVERSYGSFSRTIPLPASVERDKCEASFKNGVLKVTLQKTKEALASGIEIPLKH
jgi:HSP20 family protein